QNAGSLLKNVTAKNIVFNGSERAGLIAVADQTTIEDIVMENIQINTPSGSSSIGGVVGSIGNSTIRKVSIKDMIIRGQANTVQIGGVAGVLAKSNIIDADLDNITITNSAYRVGGLVGNMGNSSVVNDAYVRNSTVISTSNISSNAGIGGLVGVAASSTVNNSGVIDTSVSGMIYSIGGFFGDAAAVTVNNSFVDNSSNRANNRITGLSNREGTGGFVGRITGILTANNVYVDTDVIGGSAVGGYIGYLQQHGSNSTNIIIKGHIESNNASNGAAGIGARSHVGSIIGYAKEPQGSTFRNIKILTTLANAPGLQDNIHTDVGGTELSRRYNLYNVFVHEQSTINGVEVHLLPNFGGADDKVMRSQTTAELTDFDSYSAFVGDNWNFDSFSSRRTLPKLNYLANYKPNTLLRYQRDLRVPGVTFRTFTSFGAPQLPKQPEVDLPEIKIYPVTANKINVELVGKIPNNTDLEVYQGDVLLTSLDVNKNVYTFTYDYKTPLIFRVADDIKEKVKTLDPKDISSNVSSVSTDYFYKIGEDLYSNTGRIDGEYINLKDEFGLTTNGQLINLQNKNIVSVFEGVLLLDSNVTPLYTATYNGRTINTYGNFSEIIDGEVISQRDMLLFVQDEQLHIVGPGLTNKNNSFIISSNLGNDYQSYLQDNGLINNLKMPINYPKGFSNTNIKNITSNIGYKTTIILVEYNDGGVVGFDYLTGEDVINNRQNVGFKEFIGESFSKFSIFENNDTNKDYIENLNVERYLNNNSNNIIGNVNSENGINENKYVSNLLKPFTLVYNKENDSYDTISIDEIVGNVSVEEIVSKTSLIRDDSNFKMYDDANKIKINKFNGNFGVVIYVMVFAMICLVSYSLYKKLKKAK
ncbi:MAG: hypothetical protein ACRCZK_01945, partial [Oscillospiraceae bacterium]